MKILENILNGFNEILYDIMAYLLPGFITLLFFSLPLLLNKLQTPIYSLVYISNNNNNNNNNAFNLSEIFTNNALPLTIKLILIILASYLLGHIINGLAQPVSQFPLLEKFFCCATQKTEKNINEKNSFLISFKNDLLSILISTPLLSDSLLLIDNTTLEEVNKKALITYATTCSRFISHHNLIQKYIAKVNMYSSLSCISFLLFIDTIASGIYIMFNLSTLNYPSSILYFLMFLAMCSFISFLVFYKEFYRHTKLKEKECYFFLYDYIKHKNNSKLKV